jgi:hypothetical protein
MFFKAPNTAPQSPQLPALQLSILSPYLNRGTVYLIIA